MMDPAKDRRKNRTAKPVVSGPGVADLRFRLSEHAAEIDKLRSEIEGLTEEMDARDAETELLLMDLAVGGIADADDPRAARWRTHQRLRRFVREHIPRGSRIVVAGEGDDALLRYPGCKAEHLSQDRAGGYIGFHPGSSRAAVAQLEAARWRGADVLWIPQSCLWWLEHYSDLTRHLERRYALTALEEETGAVWDLRKPSPVREVDELLAGLRLGLARAPVVLDWHTGHDFARLFDECNIFSPPGDGPELPYLDGTIDVVAVPVADADRERISEARRVAAALVVAVTGSRPMPAVDVLWQAGHVDEGFADVSIIVASPDGQPSTRHFLRDLLDTLPASFTGEVLVDAAIDVRVPRLDRESARIKRIEVDAFRADAGFAARVRRGAEAASGDMLVVVEGSTWPVAGWLPPLVHLFRHVPEVGAITGMLLEPDGRLAGAVGPVDADRDRNPRGDDIGAARYTHVRRMDVAPSALFATHRQLFLEWSRRQLEDQELATAFCVHVRSGGRTVLYQPESVAISSWLDAARPVATTVRRSIDG
jgi:hypothetical protein